MLYKSREKVVKLFNNYSKVVSDTQYKPIHGEGIEILTLLNKCFKDY